LLVFGTTPTFGIGDGPLNVRQAAIAETAARLNQREREWHAWKPSDLTRINAAFRDGKAAPAPASIRDLVGLSQKFSVASDGLFDPAIGGLVELWGFHTSSFPVRTPAPTLVEINAWLTGHPRILDVRIEGDRLFSRNPAVQLDFDAIAEGAASAEVMAIFRKHGVRHALISIGGDVSALGDGKGTPWTVGMRDPYGGVLGSVQLGDHESFFTSGNYNKFRQTTGGARWGHILDPRSGMPARGAAATAVLTNDPLLADAASTALMAAGPAGFERIVVQMKLGCALMVTEENELLVTRGMRTRMEFLREPVSLGPPLDAGANCSR